MLELEEAQRRIIGAVPILPPESVSLFHANERILAENIISKVDLPGFDNSAMDGFAVRAEDLASANRSAPVSLRLIGKIPAGDTFSQQVENGQCARIFTGSPLPPGADAVVMQEDTQEAPGRPGSVLFLDSVKPWENIRFRGEDVKAGATLAEPGTRLNAGQLCLLSAVGIEKVLVARQPKLGVLATGSELCVAGQSVRPGQIFESNRVCVAALARRVGAIPEIYPLVPDTFDGTQSALRAAFQKCDVVVTTGGVSVGELDYVKAAFEKIGGTLEFWRVSMKPGKPFVLGRIGAKVLFGLPGNPVSAFVTFTLLVAPALARMQGAKEKLEQIQRGILLEPLVNSGNRRHFVRVFINSKGEIKSAGTQASHIISALANANGLIEVPVNTTLPAGAAVQVMRLD